MDGFLDLKARVGRWLFCRCQWRSSIHVRPWLQALRGKEPSWCQCCRGACHSPSLALPAPGSVVHPCPIHFNTRFWAPVSFVINLISSVWVYAARRLKAATSSGMSRQSTAGEHRNNLQFNWLWDSSNVTSSTHICRELVATKRAPLQALMNCVCSRFQHDRSCFLRDLGGLVKRPIRASCDQRFSRAGDHLYRLGSIHRSQARKFTPTSCNRNRPSTTSLLLCVEQNHDSCVLPHSGHFVVIGFLSSRQQQRLPLPLFRGTSPQAGHRTPRVQAHRLHGDSHHGKVSSVAETMC